MLSTNQELLSVAQSVYNQNEVIINKASGIESYVLSVFVIMIILFVYSVAIDKEHYL
jgi:hypothetical protein